MLEQTIRELVAAWIADLQTFRPGLERSLRSIDQVVGASDSDIEKLENRLGAPLPISYRAFLRVVNGWPYDLPFNQRLRPCHRVTWFAEENADWIRVHGDEMAELSMQLDLATHTQYPAAEYPERFYFHHFSSALQISDVGDAGVFLLNPILRDASGEWEAWFFAAWAPGAVRHATFFDMVQSTYAEERQAWVQLHRQHTEQSGK